MVKLNLKKMDRCEDTFQTFDVPVALNSFQNKRGQLESEENTQNGIFFNIFYWDLYAVFPIEFLNSIS